MNDTPTQYAAADEYLKTERAGRVPGNTPARIHNAVMAKLTDELTRQPELRSVKDPGYSARMQQWHTYTEDERLRLIPVMAAAEVRIAFEIEVCNTGNEELLDKLIKRKKALEEE